MLVPQVPCGLLLPVYTGSTCLRVVGRSTCKWKRDWFLFRYNETSTFPRNFPCALLPCTVQEYSFDGSFTSICASPPFCPCYDKFSDPLKKQTWMSITESTTIAADRDHHAPTTPGPISSVVIKINSDHKSLVGTHNS